MTKRELIHKKIKAINDKMDVLNAEKRVLIEEAYLLTDKVQQFTEKDEIWGRGKNKRSVRVGRIHWKENFKDEDSGEILVLERSCVVRNDGEWIR